jgi:hypothetical protein
MKRLLLVLAVLALVAAACSSSSVGGTPETSGADVVAPSATTETAPDEPSADSSAAPTTPSETATTSSGVEPQAEGPPARDFTLALEPTGEFVLSQEVKPVFMIFWAEW